MADVFISYSRHDRATAQLIAQALTENGVSVWWDREILAGQNYQDVIEENIALARCVLALWSKDSIRSEWVRTEANDGHERKILLPVLLERVAVPLAFRLTQIEDFTAWDGSADSDVFQHLLIQVKAMIERGPAPVAPDTSATETKPSPLANPPASRQLGAIATLAVIAVMWIAGTYSNSFKGPLAFAVGAAVVVLLLFRLAESDISPRMRALALQWLLPRKGTVHIGTAEAFNNLFEAVFGHNHFSAFCFVRAALTSVTALALFLFLVRSIYGATVELTAGVWISLIIFGGSVNVLGDYIALYKTRLILRAYKKGTAAFLLAPMDLVATVTVFVTTICLALFVIYGLARFSGQINLGDENFFHVVFHQLSQLLRQPYLDLFDPTSPDLMQIGRRRLLYASAATTFLTSIWLWAALILTPPVRTVIWVTGVGISLVGTIFDVARAPFTALGYLCALIIVFAGGLAWGGSEVYAALLH